MKIAIPVANGILCQHFGHCEEFAIIDVDETGQIKSMLSEEPPPHEPGVLPAWLKSKGVGLVIAGGMGQSAQMIFSKNNISVTVGAPALSPEKLVHLHVAGTLKSGSNLCDH